MVPVRRLTGLRLVIADHALGLPVFRALSGSLSCFRTAAFALAINGYSAATGTLAGAGGAAAGIATFHPDQMGPLFLGGNTPPSSILPPIKKRMEPGVDRPHRSLTMPS